jgi:hypothetical protein
VGLFAGQAGEDEIWFGRHGGGTLKRDANLLNKGFAISTAVADDAKSGGKQVGGDGKAKLANSHHTDGCNRHFSPLFL